MNLQEIANELGISRSTVSRALRGDERISAKTREKVALAAKELGYKSNPYLSILMAKLREGALPNASPIIAFLNPNPDHDSWYSKKTFLLTYQGAENRAKELGFTLEEFHLGQAGMSGSRLRDILIARNIRAVIMASDGDDDASKVFNTNGFAAVNISTANRDENIHSVASDFLGNTFKAIQSLRSLGYQRIGLALENSELLRMRGLPRMAFLEHEHTLPSSERIGFWIGPPSDLRGFADWLLEKRPDAIITSDWLPQKWLQPMGLKIPDDIGVAQLEPLFYPFENSGIDGRFANIGAAAIDLVVSQIAANDFTPPAQGNTMLTKGVWRNGWSTRDKTADNLSTVYNDNTLELIQTASLFPTPELEEARNAAIAQSESYPFELAAGNGADSWRSVSLDAIANNPYEAPPWPPKFPEPLSLPSFTGEKRIAGVPFHLPKPKSNKQNTCLALCQTLGNGEIQLHRIPVPSKERIRAVYFCHFSFYGWHGEATAGRYNIVYADGSCESQDLRSYNPPAFPASKATHQDSWSAHPQFNTPRCKHFLLPSKARPIEEDRYGYVLEIRIPNNGKKVQSIEFESNPKSDTAILVVAVSLLVEPA